MSEEKSTQLTVSLPRFDGPFDLLLALIRRNEWPIGDLPVVEITGQFLAYVRSAQQIDAELCGEFVEVASWLVLLKSRSLLPADPFEHQTPAEELRRAVLDHATLEAATGFLRAREGGKLHPATPGVPAGRREQFLPRSGEEAPTVQDVLEAARKALEAAHAAASFRETELVGVTVEEQVEWIAERLASLPPHAPLSTAEWFAVQPSKGARAALLLAMLELARKGFLLLHQPREFAPLQVKAIREIPEYIELDLLAYAPAG